MQTLAKPDPSLPSYIEVLQRQSKFKAKVVYTLSCIQNVLTSSPTSYITNLEYLTKYENVLAQIASLYGESPVLEPLAQIFYRFQALGVGGACMKFLDLLEKVKIEGQTSDRLIQYICKMLNLLKHRYPKTKEICLKLLENQETKLSESQTQVVLSTMINSSTISKAEFLQLGKFSKINIPPVKILELMWRSGLKTNEKNDSKQKEVELEVMNKYLIDGWSDELIKYACLRACTWSSTTSLGFVEQISPRFFDRFLKNELKPFYPLEDRNKGIEISKHFKQTVQHCSNEYHNQSLSSQISQIIPFFSQNADYAEILTCISSKTQISKRNQVRYHPLIAMELLTYPQAILPKLQLNPKPSEAFKVLRKLQSIPVDFNNEMVLKIYLLILQIQLCHKQCTYLKQIQWVLKFSLRNSLKSLLPWVEQNIEYALFAPFALKSISQLNSQQKLSFLKSVDTFIGSQTLKLQFKFYIAAKMVKLREQKSVHKFINYLLRNLNKDELPYEEIAFYLKNYEVAEEDVQWIYAHFEEQLERVQEKIFGKLASFDFKAPKLIIFALQKLDVFQQWLPIYRWTLNPLDEPNFENPQGLIDSLEVFETVIENCQNIPIEIIKKFFQIVAKFWQDYNHQHMFTIERISQMLFSDQELNTNQKQEITSYLKSLMHRQWKSTNPQIYRLSLVLLLTNTLMEESEEIESSLTKIIFKEIAKADQKCLSNYAQLKTLIFAQQIVMWRFQYEEITIHQKVGEVLLKILNTHDQTKISSENNREILVQNSLQIISSVGHECNLLELKLLNILRNYIHNKSIVSFALQILLNVKDANVKAIAKFELQRMVPQVLIALTLSEDEELNKNYADFLKEMCLQETPYKSVLSKNKCFVMEIFRAETIFLSEKCRQEVAIFLIQYLKANPNQEVHEGWISNLWLKYYTNEQVRNFCEQMKPHISTMKNKNLNLLDSENKNEMALNSLATKSQVEEENIIEAESFVQNQQEVAVSQNAEKRNERSEEKIKEVNDPIIPQTTEQGTDEEQGSPKKKKKFGISMTMEIEEEPQDAKTEPAPYLPPQAASFGRKKDKQQQSFGFGGSKIPKSNSTSSPTKKKKNSGDKQQQMEKIKDIKGHITFIGSLSNQVLDEESLTKLRQSFTYLTDVVGLHTYYCQKVVVSGAINKCLSLHPSVLKSEIDRILDFFEEIAENKEKNLTIFNDAKSIDFLKNTLKQSITSRKDKSSNEKVISIIQKCWSSSSNEFFTNGLLSMLFEMAKIDLSRVKTLQLLSNNDLSFQIINQVYQRGLFNVMETIYKTPNESLQQSDKLEIIHWAKLIGKVAQNQSIREKLFSINLHELALTKLDIFQEMSYVSNLAYMFANFTKEFDKIASWLLQKRVPEIFIQEMEAEQEKISPDYYEFFRFFALNGKEYVDYLFRIKFNTHMLSVLKRQNFLIGNEGLKHFFKALSHLFTPEHYQKFLKQEIVKLLLAKYDLSRSVYIMQCLERLIEQIQDKKQLEILESQGFFSISKVFNSKVKDDMSYNHVLQMYIILLRKFKKFNEKEMGYDLVIKVIRKGIFSINMDGKKKSIEFINELSEVDKVSYGYSSCYRMFQSLFNYNFGYEEICFFENYLNLQCKYGQPVRASEEARKQEMAKYPVRYKKVTQIANADFLDTLINKYLEIRNKLENAEGNSQQNRKSIDKMVSILLMFCTSKPNEAAIFEKIKWKILEKCYSHPYVFESTIRLLSRFTSNNALCVSIRNSPNWDILEYIQNLHSYIEEDVSKRENLIIWFVELLKNATQNSLCERAALIGVVDNKIKNSKYKDNADLLAFLSKYKTLQTQEKITDKMKQTVTKGIKVKMYKSDGSNSSLILFFTPDLMELNCVASIGGPVKTKWRLALREISSIEEYRSDVLFKKSVFYLSEGIFTKPPPIENCLTLVGKQKQFCICFQGSGQLKEWKTYIEMGIQRAINFLGEINLKPQK